MFPQKLLPELTHAVDDVVFALDESLRLPATEVAVRRAAGLMRVSFVSARGEWPDGCEPLSCWVPCRSGCPPPVQGRLRAKGRKVDLILEAKKMKWVLKARRPFSSIDQPAPATSPQLHRVLLSLSVFTTLLSFSHASVAPPSVSTQRAQTVNAERLVLLGGDEWAKGNVRVKTLASFEEKDVPAAEV